MYNEEPPVSGIRESASGIVVEQYVHCARCHARAAFLIQVCFAILPDQGHDSASQWWCRFCVLNVDDKRTA